MLLRDFKNWFYLWRLAHVGVIYLVWVQFVAVLLLDESTLVAEPLFCQALAATIPNFLLA